MLEVSDLVIFVQTSVDYSFKKNKKTINVWVH